MSSIKSFIYLYFMNQLTSALPPFGVAAKHPRYGYGGYGGNYGGNNDYVIALRYLSAIG